MRVFDLELEPSIVDQIAAHAERDYPIEACGVVLGRPGEPSLRAVVPLKNQQDRYHALDPIAFPRDGRDAFRVDELERMRMLEAAEAEGLAERILYHSHCDAGAYFSPEDRAMAVVQGIELMPGVVHVVVSIRNGKRVDLAAFRFNPDAQRFDEVRIGSERTDRPASDLELPSLELRSMEGRESSRPIPPYGGQLVPRRVTVAEKERLQRLAEKMHIKIDREESIRDLRRFELGLYSPLPGFLRSVETRSIEQSGRLLSGTPWRTPVILEITAKKTASLPAAGSLVELVDGEGTALAALGLVEVFRSGKDTARLAGPIYVYDSGAGPDAADSRAQLLRKGASAVLALRSVGGQGGSDSTDELKDAFDEIVRPPFLGRNPWLDAVMAQNCGATHILIDDPGFARIIEETLQIVPWRTGLPVKVERSYKARSRG